MGTGFPWPILPVLLKLPVRKCFHDDFDKKLFRFWSQWRLWHGTYQWEDWSYTNLKIEEYSKRQTTYAIGSNLDQDEPMFLVIDDSMVDGMVILKYVPDSDGSEIGPEVPVETEKLKVR